MSTALAVRPSTDVAASTFDNFDTDAFADFIDLALRRPTVAARQLAPWFDRNASNHKGCMADDAAAMDNFGHGDDSLADLVAVIARGRGYPLGIKLALAAVVAGWRALQDDVAVQEDVLMLGWMADEA